MFKTVLLGCLACLTAAKLADRIDPRPEKYEADPDNISLAVTERLTIPLFGAISQEIQYVPKNAGECKFSQTLTKYKQIAQHPFDRHQETIITSILTLTTHELVFTIDQFFFLSVYSLKLQNALKEQVSPRKLIKQNSTSFSSNPKLIATPDEKVVYVLSPFGYSYFYVDSLSTEIKTITETPLSAELYEGFVFQGYLFLANGQAGVGIYKIEDNHDLKFASSIEDLVAMDLKIDQTRKLLYVLDFNRGIYVYDIHDPSKPIEYDTLNLQNITYANSNIQINDRIILVMFYRGSKNTVAQLNYDPVSKTFSFLRYFKFKSNIVEIHLMDTHFIALGNEFLGIFPISIHPKLIKQEQNGFISLSPIKTAKVYEPPFFIGVTQNTIVLGALDIEQKETIQCSLAANSTLQKIIYKANLTTCGDTLESPRQYYDYCEFKKEINIKRMDIVARAGVAGLIWILLILFTTLFVAGVVLLCIMRLKKVTKIKKMEQQFEQKRINIVLPSARMTDRIGSDVRA